MSLTCVFLLQLKADTRVELPLWLAQILYTATFVTLDLPKHYRPAFRNHLLADPSVPTLPPYYYAVGQRLALLYPSDARLFTSMLLLLDATGRKTRNC
jgi:hypothetical protein